MCLCACLHVCVCARARVGVCVREQERERDTHTHTVCWEVGRGGFVGWGGLHVCQRPVSVNRIAASVRFLSVLN